eukprot:TRINITY_DN63782_c0_g1_i1.p1 TRINITY_DN63782_c0_g1~~TRINITY_DN63782_c0_g1_i1.p1  ORF type:complete len:176 (-),score=32.33 TRINITY_DN63782_c0_g1_i1:88-615(-)
MPKVVTFRRTPVFTNMRQKLTDDNFNVFHCKRCSTHVIITDVDLASLSRRRTDGAYILDARKAVVRLNTERKEGAQLIRREKGVERQHIHACSSCGKDVGYTTTPHEEDFQLLYLSETAVTVPWHKKKTPWVCKVCGYVCQSEVHLEAHKKQRQHFGDEGLEAMAEAGTNPIIVG